MFPRGGQLPGQKYESGERTSNNLIKWASRSVPNKIKVLPNQGEIPEWLDKVRGRSLCPFLHGPHAYTHVGSDVSWQNIDLPRVILLNRDKKFPLLWQVLGNNYHKKIAFGHHSDPEGNFAASLGFTAREEGKYSKVIVYPAGSSVPILFEGKRLLVRSCCVGSLNARCRREQVRATVQVLQVDSGWDGGLFEGVDGIPGQR